MNKYSPTSVAYFRFAIERNFLTVFCLWVSIRSRICLLKTSAMHCIDDTPKTSDFTTFYDEAEIFWIFRKILRLFIPWATIAREIKIALLIIAEQWYSPKKITSWSLHQWTNRYRFCSNHISWNCINQLKPLPVQVLRWRVRRETRLHVFLWSNIELYSVAIFFVENVNYLVSIPSETFIRKHEMDDS